MMSTWTGRRHQSRNQSEACDVFAWVSESPARVTSALDSAEPGETFWTAALISSWDPFRPGNTSLR